MKYPNTVQGTFIDRPNRFIAHVEVNGAVETVHVKNTGRCKELLLPGVEVTLAVSDNPTRKTKYDLIAVVKQGVGLINIDSQAPNAVVKEWLETRPAPFADMTLLKPEHTYGNSRVDFYLECGQRRVLLEVKGCTLEMGGEGYFPDAPTERGGQAPAGADQGPGGGIRKLHCLRYRHPRGDEGISQPGDPPGVWAGAG